LFKKKVNIYFFLIIFFFIITIYYFIKVKEEVNIDTKLITSVHKDLPFKFETEKNQIIIKPGEVKKVIYTVKNTSNKIATGMATFQIYPSELKDYVTKMNCFCYEAQTLKGGEKEKYELVLLVDPKVTKNIKEAIIQFVFFKK
tara:strand:- start:2039 stop:2467 length:429 start_codon:yes stop_codon:yes gene_type:complete